MKQYSAHEIARFFLALVDPDDNDLSNLKLQKLCYYAQGFGTALRGEPLFREALFAWDHGPVVPDLYRALKGNGSQPVPPDNDFDMATLEERDRDFLTELYSLYGQFSAWRLRNMTHNEQPWLEARQTDSKEITLDSLVAYFGPQVDDEYKGRVYGAEVPGSKS